MNNLSSLAPTALSIGLAALLTACGGGGDSDRGDGDGGSDAPLKYALQTFVKLPSPVIATRSVEFQSGVVLNLEARDLVNAPANLVANLEYSTNNGASWTPLSRYVDRNCGYLVPESKPVCENFTAFTDSQLAALSGPGTPLWRVTGTNNGQALAPRGLQASGSPVKADEQASVFAAQAPKVDENSMNTQTLRFNSGPSYLQINRMVATQPITSFLPTDSRNPKLWTNGNYVFWTEDDLAAFKGQITTTNFVTQACRGAPSAPMCSGETRDKVINTATFGSVYLNKEDPTGRVLRTIYAVY